MEKILKNLEVAVFCMCSLTLEEIKATTDRRRLLELAWMVQGTIHSGSITPEYYEDCMLELSRKLGFPVTVPNLEKETAKYVEGE